MFCTVFHNHTVHCSREPSSVIVNIKYRNARWQTGLKKKSGKVVSGQGHFRLIHATGLLFGMSEVHKQPLDCSGFDFQSWRSLFEERRVDPISLTQQHQTKPNQTKRSACFTSPSKLVPKVNFFTLSFQHEYKIRLGGFVLLSIQCVKFSSMNHLNNLIELFRKIRWN